MSVCSPHKRALQPQPIICCPLHIYPSIYNDFTEAGVLEIEKRYFTDVLMSVNDAFTIAKVISSCWDIKASYIVTFLTSDI